MSKNWDRLVQGNSPDSRISGDGRLPFLCKSVLQIGFQFVQLVDVRALFVKYGLQDPDFCAQQTLQLQKPAAAYAWL